MGLLKHVVLPYFALLRTAGVIRMLLTGDEGRAGTARKLGLIGEEQDSITSADLFLETIIGGFQVAFLFAVLMGIVQEHAHYRGIVTVMELIVWAVALYACHLYDFGSVTFCLVNTAIAAIGLAVHSQEPGIFTKDNKATKNT